MERIVSFLEMGGYGGYVWPAFILTAAVLAGLAVATLREHRRQRRLLASLEQAVPQRRRRKTRSAGGKTVPEGDPAG